MSNIQNDIEALLAELLDKRENHYILEDNITVDYEEQYGSPYLWFEDRRGSVAFAWLFNIEKEAQGYKFISDKYEYIECRSLQEVFDVVKAREY